MSDEDDVRAGIEKYKAAMRARELAEQAAAAWELDFRSAVTGACSAPDTSPSDAVDYAEEVADLMAQRRELRREDAEAKEDAEEAATTTPEPEAP